MKPKCREMCALPPFYLLFFAFDIIIAVVVVVWILATEVMFHELALTLSEVFESYHSRRIELKED